MTAQSFLLGAYVLLKNNPAYYYTELNKLPDIYVEQTSLLSYLVCLSGFVTAICSFSGVLAAYIAISAWRSKVKQGEQKLLTSDAPRHFLGGLGSILPATLFASIWILLLCNEKSWLKLTNTQTWTPIFGVLLGLVVWLSFILIDFRFGFGKKG
jgi:hypothetical protein